MTNWIKSLLAATMAIGTVLTTAAAFAEPVNLKFASFVPGRSKTMSDVMAPFAEDVNAASNGTLNIEFFPGGVLGRAPAQQLKLLQDGVTDIAYIIPAYTPGVFPDNEIFELPLLAQNVNDGTMAIWRMFEQGQLRGYEDLKVLGLFATPQVMHTTFPLDDLGAFQGKKIRSAGYIQNQITEALGAVPVGMVATQMAESVSRGLVTGLMADWNVLKIYGLQDFTTHHLEAPMGLVPVLVAMNKDKYESLPQEAKDALEQFSGEAFSQRYIDVLGPVLDAGKAEFEASPDHTVRSLTEAEYADWRERFQPLYNKWRESVPDGDAKFAAYEKILSDLQAE